MASKLSLNIVEFKTIEFDKFKKGKLACIAYEFNFFGLRFPLLCKMTAQELQKRIDSSGYEAHETAIYQKGLEAFSESYSCAR